MRCDEATKRIKVIGITGKRLPPEKLAFMKRHADAFFYKPFDVLQFARRAADLLGIARPAEAVRR